MLSIILNIILTGICVTLYRKVNRDSYTKLLNKEQFNRDIKRLRRADDRVVLIDIDKFKQINDTHGHKYGDQVIEDVAEQIRKTIRFSDKAYRIGGDEFAIVTNSAFNCDRLVKNIKTSVSVGIGKTYEEADANMYIVKNSKRQ